MGARLAIVTLNWNGSDDTLACIESLEQARTTSFDLIVVDNGSRAEDVARVAAAVAARPWATLARNPENLGFAGGSNVGIERALADGADFVMLLNNDATVEPGAIEALVAYAEANPSVGAVSPVILDDTGERIWAAGGVRASREVVCRLGLAGRPASAVPSEPFAPYALIGCAMVVRREVFERVGAFDADYFAYVEDVDFSRRAAEAGFGLAVVPAARVRHKGAASSGGGYTRLRSYLMGRGTALFVRRRASLGQRVGFAVFAPLGLVAATVRESFRGNARAVAAKLRGYLDGLRARPVDAQYFHETRERVRNK